MGNVINMLMSLFPLCNMNGSYCSEVVVFGAFEGSAANFSSHKSV